MPKKIDQKKIKRTKNEEFAKRYQKFHSKEEKRAAKRERIKERELKWALQYYGVPTLDALPVEYKKAYRLDREENINQDF